jgi:arginyl-tRNA synthetase
LNFKLNRPAFAEELLLRSVPSEDFWRPNVGGGKRVIIDMSSPNIAKPFGIGHLRSTMIGNAIYRILRETGHDTANVNHLGDWGTHFGKMIVAYLKWGKPEAMKASDNITKEYLALYVKFHEEAERHPELEAEAREWFRKLEGGDAQATVLWREMIGESLRQFNKLYDRLGVSFDHVLGESFYNDKMGAVVDSLRGQGLLEESDGALVVRLDENGMPPCLLVKSDGTSIYATRDLATALYRRDQMNGELLLYVVGGEQALHFQQVFRVLEKMDSAWRDRCRHIPFGLMMMEGQKMSTRRGKVLFLEDVLNEAVQQARSVIEAKNPALTDKDAVAEAVGIGAVVFGDLKNTRTLDVDFSLQEVLNFDGETGPYLQYTYARTSSILRKAGAASPDGAGISGQPAFDFSLADNEYAWSLLKLIARYPLRLRQAAERYEPSVLARYLLELAQAFNRFYHHVKVLDGSSHEQAFKLSLVRAAAETLRKGLTLLGLRALEEL